MDDEFDDIGQDSPAPRREYDFDSRFKESDDWKAIQQVLKKLHSIRDKVEKSQEKFEYDRRKVEASEDPVWLQKIEHHYERLSRLGYPRHEIPEVPVINLAKYSILPSKNPENDEAVEAKSTKGKVWSPEELVKLERLLKEFPDEPVQGHRWEKIARALGNRTPRQVASRVMKLFARMTRAGVPVPGKFNADTVQKKAKRRRGFKPHPTTISIHTSHIQYYRAPTVPLPEDSDSEDAADIDAEAAMQVDDDEDMKKFAHLKDTQEFRELMRLKKLQHRKQSRAREVYLSENQSTETVHFGFQCDSCGVEPIVGTRFHCLQCVQGETVDLCSKCHQDGTFTTEYHSRSHRFQRFEEAEETFFVDTDYDHHGAASSAMGPPPPRRRASQPAASSSAQSRLARDEMAYLDDNFMPV